MVAADARTAITFSLSPGQAHDAPEGRKLLTRLGPQRPGLSLLMDRAYEGNETRQLASASGFMPVVPPLSTRVHPWAYDREMYQRRNEIERLFRRLMGHVALDGTKVRANASKHKAMSYKRMKEKEAQLTAEVAELLRRAQEVDEEEDRRYGKDKRGDELPEELAFREGRLQKIREAMAALEAEAQAAAEQAEVEGKTHPGVPEDKAQRNFTDAESRIMPGPGGRDFQQAYNCQAVVDHAHLVIVAARATNQSSDKQQAVGMIEETISNTGAVPREVSADAGYYSAKAVDELYALGVDPFVAPEQTRHGRVVPPAPRGRIPKRLSPRDRMRRKLQTRRGRQRYALRMATVEPVFGQIKAGRGFRQFLLRGLDKVQGEWSLICTGPNLLKLFRLGRLAPG